MLGDDSGEYHANYMLMQYHKDSSALYVSNDEALEDLLVVWIHIAEQKMQTASKRLLPLNTVQHWQHATRTWRLL